MDKISENLFMAIDTIIQSRISELNYDKTVICTITDNSERLKGLYKVKQYEGTAEFEAYSEIVSYKVGMQVYVTIPQGDYSQTKTIIGRYVSNNDQVKTVKYMEPFDNCLDVTGNLITGEPVTALLANGETKLSDVLWTWTSESGEDVEGFSRLGLSADFQALLNDYYPTSGSYGLLLEIHGETIDGKTIPSTFLLDSSDMYGNPLYFDTYFNQQIIFDINEFRNIKKMEIKFYQDANFLDINGKLLPTKMGEGDFVSSIGYNLFVKNLYLFLGYDLSEFNEETLILYTPDSLTYDSRIQNNSQTKNLRLRWIRKVDENTFVQSQENLTDSTRIHWYKYEKDAKDEIAGDFWVEIEEGKNKLEFEYNPELLINSNEIKAIICYNDEMDYTWSLNEEIEKCVKYESNILKLESVYEIADQGAIDSVNALEFNFVNDIYEGVYNIYGIHKKIKNGADAIRERQIVPSLHFANGDIVQINEIDNVKVTWEVPYINSMIIPSSEGYDKENEHYIINDSILRYKIKSIYNEQYTRNTVKCKVVYNGQTYENTISLTFGVAGTAGSDYTFVITADKDALIIGKEDEKIVLTATLYDYNDEIVELTDKTVKWSWLDSDSPKALMIPDTGLLGNKITLPIDSKSIEKNGNNSYYYNIIKASLNVEVTWEPRENEATPKPRNISMEAVYAIPFKKEPEYYISGATEVIYNDAGSNPTYSKDKYQLYGSKSILEGLVWSREFYYIELDENKNKTEQEKKLIESREGNYHPEVRSKKLKDANGKVYDIEYYLSPKNVFVGNASNNIAVVCHQGSVLLWAQPIYVWQDKHGSTMLNRWDGNLTINEENGIILSTMVGAGKKNSDNTFSGVLMGDVAEASDDSLNGIGLYGFHQGTQSFGFKVDGTAFIGKSGRGRIEFDGNNGIIQSGNFKENKLGMFIDLETGILKSYNNKGSIEINPINSNALFKIQGVNSSGDMSTMMLVGQEEYYLKSIDYIYKEQGMRINLSNGNLNTANKSGWISITPSDENSLFKIRKSTFETKDDGTINHTTKTLMNVGNNSYYLQSANYSSGSSGMKINLDNGSIDAANFSIDSDGNASFTGKITSSEIDNGKFYVDKDGNLTATSATITGEINATSGTFSGTITASGTISGGTISGATVSGSTISGGTIKIGNITLSSSDGVGYLYFNSNKTLYFAGGQSQVILYGGGLQVNGGLAGTSLTANEISSKLKEVIKDAMESYGFLRSLPAHTHSAGSLTAPALGGSVSGSTGGVE